MADSNTTLVLSEAQLEQRDLLQKKAAQLHAAVHLIAGDGRATFASLPETHQSSFLWLLEDLAEGVHTASILAFDVVPGVAHA